MMSRSQALQAIVAGNLIYGIGEAGRGDLLLVYGANDTGFYARNVPSQMTYRFGQDGEGRRIEDGRKCTIVSTAALPPEQYQVAISLDRRMGSRPEYPDTRLTEDEVQLILKHAEFFEERLLPGTEAIVKRAQKLRAVQGLLTLEWDPFHADDNPSSVFEYDDYAPDLVDLLDKHAAEDEVVRFLAKIAGLRGRPPGVVERAEAAAVGLFRLRQEWL